MILCLDCGNSRLKWGLHDGAEWLAQGALAHDEIAALAGLLQRWPQPGQVLLANVAGPAVGTSIRRSLGNWADRLQEVRSTASCAGVSNHYVQPERLGVDRWCALIGAWGQTQAACLVVMAGTATTIDTLDAGGNFLGGLILPGSELMRRALARDTAGLPLADGHWSAAPRSTEDAITTGAIEAQVGAIERAFARLGAPAAVCLVSGGNADVLLPRLAMPSVRAQNLPLEGLLRIGRSQ
ncbi:MAG: type III pantothenate kinase [Betaproteobacteria bacterium HGW-Betaproteobacteria-7]|jgi:type III pantothenate kinase|nr:MAG: type III pantothenate kinase [Betaproteobacteria bacterium HGW-Betaproteobacteria-7]